MTDEEYARYSPWQQQLQPVPTTVIVRLSDEDVARIADAVVARLKADPCGSRSRS